MLRLLPLLAWASSVRALRSFDDAAADRVMAALGHGLKDHSLDYQDTEAFDSMARWGKQQEYSDELEALVGSEATDEGPERPPLKIDSKEYLEQLKNGKVDKATVDKAMDDFEDEGKMNSPYSRFVQGQDWEDLSFEERWEQFRTAVPLEQLQDHWNPKLDTGPVCWPSSDGPVESEKLAIVIHGFTSCGGSFYPLTKRLVAAGYRVLRPTLPGHGRKYTLNTTKTCKIGTAQQGVSEDCMNHFLKHSCNWTRTDSCESETARTKMSSKAIKCCCDERLGEVEEGDLPCVGEEVVVKYQDDLSQMPLTPGPYLVFAEALGKLIEQYKKEHPEGHLLVVGHSLGGMVAAKFALERAHLVDRFLLLNPMLGLSTGFVKPLLNTLPNFRLSWTSLGEPDCDNQRAVGNGGNCQFFMGNVGAMADLAYIVLCRHWGMKEACKARGGTALGITVGLGAGTGTGLSMGGGIIAGITSSVASPGFGVAHVAFGTAVAKGASAAAAGTIAAGAAKGAAVGALGGPAAPVTVPVGLVVGIVFASLGVALAAGVVGSVLIEGAQETVSLLAIRNSTRAMEIRQNFGLLKEFQMLSTTDDPAINNVNVHALYRLVEQSRRVKLAIDGFGISGKGFWPKEVSHCYNNARFVHHWFTPFVQNAVEAFCTEGQKVPVIDDKASIITSRRQVDKKLLTILPILPFFRPGQPRGYQISHWPLDDASTWAEEIFNGRVQRFCGYRMFERRWDDVTVIDPKWDGMLLVTKGANFQSKLERLFVFESPVYVREDSDCQKRCLSAPLASLDPLEPLYPQLNEVRHRWESERSRFNFRSDEIVDLCKDKLVDVVCSRLHCETASAGLTGEADEKLQLWGSPRANMTFVNQMSCNVTFRSFFGKQVTLRPGEVASTDWAFNIASFWKHPRGKVAWSSCVGDGEEMVSAGQTLTILPDDSADVDGEWI